MTPTTWRWLRLSAGAVILAVLVWRLGTGPFLDGLRTVDGWSLAAAAVIGLLTTVCCAWRWSLVAGGLGAGVRLPAALAAYYRSQFLNTTLPGGVLGDVHRGLRHGREAGDVGLGLRAVGWERAAGQGVQILLAAILLSVLPSPVRSSMPAALTVLAAILLGAVLLTLALPGGRTSRLARLARGAVADIRAGLLDRGAWPGVLLASAVVVAGHTATFLIAAHAAGSQQSIPDLLPLAVLVLLAMGLPLNVGGWGPREGMAAWAFAAAGFGAAQGISAAVAYGVMVFVASLPGAAVLLAQWLRPRRALHGGAATAGRRAPAAAGAQGGGRG